MKIETTIENKKKFFALYWGQRVLRHQSANHWNPEVNEYCVSLINDGHYLNLKPLSAISDEDAKTVAEFMGFKGWDALTAKAMILTLFLINSNDPIKEELIIKQMLFKFSDISSTVDLFRKLGYAYEWQGVSVEELIAAGWVKLIEP